MDISPPLLSSNYGNQYSIGCGVFRQINLIFNGTGLISSLAVCSGQFEETTVSASKISQKRNGLVPVKRPGKGTGGLLQRLSFPGGLVPDRLRFPPAPSSPHLPPRQRAHPHR
jgi:hypothetical protein